MKGIKTAQRRQARGTRREEGGNQRRTPCHPAPGCCASCRALRTPCASPLMPRAAHPLRLSPLAARRAPLAPRRHPLYGRSVAAPYVAARRSPHMPLASSPRAARLAPLPRAHRLIGAAPLETAGAGHLRQGDVRRFAMPDEDGESTMIGHGTFPRAQRARCCVRPRGGGRRRAGSEGGHPGAAMTNAICCVWSM
jgi:hypothetical protein